MVNVPTFIPYAEIAVGDKVRKTILITGQAVIEFSKLYNDTASFHVSDELATRTIFGKRICHGIHLAGYFAEVMGKQLPGFGTIYLNQVLAFRHPVYIGETIVVTVTVVEKLPGNRLRMATTISNLDKKTVIDGEAIVRTYQ